MTSIFDGETYDTVVSIRSQAIEALKTGGQVTQWSSEGTSVTLSQGMSIRQILDETLKYLQNADPDVWGTPPIKKTIPAFY